MKYSTLCWFPLIIIGWIVLIVMAKGFCFTALAIFLPPYLAYLAVKKLFEAVLAGEF
jgi:hypothetical protein